MILRTLYIFMALVWGALPAAVHAGPMLVETERGVVLLTEGRDHMIAFRLDAAEASFSELAAQPGGDLAAQFHLTKIALWKAMILEQDALYDAFFDQSETLFDLLDEAPESPWTTQFRAETELYRGVIHGKKQEFTRAALALRRAYNEFERNVTHHPEFHESYAGMGLCYVAVGVVPKSFRWMLKLFGFSGGVTEGLEMIKVAAEQSQYYREEAAVYFAITDQFVNESKEEGLAYLAALHERYPESPVVSYVYGFGLLNDRHAVEAVRLLRTAQRQLDAPGTFTMPYVTYVLADALFAQNEFADAARYFRQFLDTFPGEALVAQANLSAGLALEMDGRRAEALPYYERIRVRDHYDSDAAARAEAELRIAAPLSAHEKKLLLGRNAFDSGRYDEAVGLLQPVLGDQSAPAILRAEAAYRSGRAFHLLGNAREALRHYRFAVANPGDPLAKWGPWSQFYVGEVYESQGAHDEARAAYREVLDYDEPFAYHKALEQRAKAALGRL